MTRQYQAQTEDMESGVLTSNGADCLYFASGVWDGASVEITFINPFQEESVLTGSTLTEDAQKLVDLPAGFEFKLKLSNCGAATVLSFGIQ